MHASGSVDTIPDLMLFRRASSVGRIPFFHLTFQGSIPEFPSCMSMLSFPRMRAFVFLSAYARFSWVLLGPLAWYPKEDRFIWFFYKEMFQFGWIQPYPDPNIKRCPQFRDWVKVRSTSLDSLPIPKKSFCPNHTHTQIQRNRLFLVFFQVLEIVFFTLSLHECMHISFPVLIVFMSYLSSIFMGVSSVCSFVIFLKRLSLAPVDRLYKLTKRVAHKHTHTLYQNLMFLWQFLHLQDQKIYFFQFSCLLMNVIGLHSSSFVRFCALN